MLPTKCGGAKGEKWRKLRGRISSPGTIRSSTSTIISGPVNGDVPDFPRGTGMDRRMSIIRLGDGRLVFHNAIPLDDHALAQVIAWGKPSILIVPMHLHATDAAGLFSTASCSS